MWTREPCGRCHHDVNAHERIDGEDIAGECEREGCTCEGFIDKYGTAVYSTEPER